MVVYTYKVPIASQVYILFVILYLLAYKTGLAQSPSRASLSRKPIAAAQPTPDTISLDVTKNLAEQLVPFDSLYQMAVLHSSIVQVDEAIVEGKVAGLQFTRVIIFQGVVPFFAYTSGNQAFLSSGSVTSDVLQLANGRRMGINIQIPVSEIIGRRHRISQLKAEVKAASARREISKLELKRELHRIYQAALTTHRLLKIRINDSQLAMIAFRVAEVEMQQGKISPAALATSSSVYAATQINIEKERGDLLNSLFDLSALVGVDLQQLIVRH